MSVFNASVLLLPMNFVMTLSKYSADPLGYRHSYFDNVMMNVDNVMKNVMTNFMINNRTDA